ncbi:MAG TPA: hypothetical protein VGQ59_02935 [Cyclobacteriaceae bacterium]|jgi:hypothetical protein|nr:hypothetical protein [Cyclobacteriaceae bacterium]
MKDFSSTIIQWPEDALQVYVGFRILSKYRDELSLNLDGFCKYLGLTAGKFENANALQEHLLALLFEVNLPVKVQMTNDGEQFEYALMKFMEVKDFLVANQGFKSTVFYPAHFPTSESCAQLVEEEYVKNFKK